MNHVKLPRPIIWVRRTTKIKIWSKTIIEAYLSFFVGSFTLSVTASEDTVIHGGTIYTADKTRPLAEALVVREGKLIHVGTLAMAKRLF